MDNILNKKNKMKEEKRKKNHRYKHKKPAKQYHILLRVAYIEGSNTKPPMQLSSTDFMTGLDQRGLHRSVDCISNVVFDSFMREF